jgi:formylglycine-generating enzyme required for sulfatase activity
MDDSITQEVAENLIAAFREQHGDGMLEVACYAAFPLTLTAELVYCLRQAFCTVPWYGAAVVLSSELCPAVGPGLYVMPVMVRNLLLKRLIDRHGEAGLYELADFMGEYIRYRLQGSGSDSTVRSHGEKPQWIALGMLNPDHEVTKEIRRQLAERLRSEDLARGDRLRLVGMVRSVGDLLGVRGFKAITLRQLTEQLRLGQPIEAEEPEDLAAAMHRSRFPELKTSNIEYVTIELGEGTEELERFGFETVRCDGAGKVVEKLPREAWRYVENEPEGLGLEMVAIVSGKFLMGSLESEKDSFDRERPQHEVTVQPFFMGRFPVTQGQWRMVAGLPQVEREMKAEPSNFKGDPQLPVEQVSWWDAIEFCKRLSVATGRDYRLPSEAEWEYACRAGTETPFYFGEKITKKLVNHDGSKTNPVGELPPNEFGLCDMHGNVWEWCEDHWHSGYKGAPIDGRSWVDKMAETEARRVLRGGSWADAPWFCRSAYRNINSPAAARSYFGFRVVCVSPRTQP